MNTVNGHPWIHAISVSDEQSQKLYQLPSSASTVNLNSFHPRAQEINGNGQLSMDHRGSLGLVELISPSVESLIETLQECKGMKDLIHVYIILCSYGLEGCKAIGNYLIPLFLEYGNLLGAHKIFSRLVYKNEYTWTCLIQGYAQNGDVNHAFCLFTSMWEDDVQPSVHTYTALLNGFAKQRCIESGQIIHTEVVCKGFDGDGFISNSLVGIYTKCGLFQDAKQVFSQIQYPDVVSWNVLVSGLIEHGLNEEALERVDQMKLNEVNLTAITYVCGLKACSSMRALCKGRAMHDDVIKGGFENNTFICNALVDMYVKCNAVVEAREVLDAMKTRDIVSWNSLMGGYAEQSQAEEALQCLKEMALTGRSGNNVTFLLALKACSSAGNITTSLELHMEISKKGFENDLYIGTALIANYSECGSLIDACNVFYGLYERSIVAWNTLISGYVDNGHGEEALLCFEEMLNEGVDPSVTTYVCALKACGIIRDKDKGYRLHACIVREKLESDAFVGSALVYMYMKCALYSDTSDVFEDLPIKDIVSWNTLINGYAEHGLGKEALEHSKSMQLKTVIPNAATFVGILKACGNIKDIVNGHESHSEIIRRGFDDNALIENALVNMYAKCGALVEAQNVFDVMQVKGATSQTTLSEAYAKNGSLIKGQEMVNKLSAQGIVCACTSLISGYVEHGFTEEAMINIERMQVEGLCLDAAMLVFILKSCGKEGAIETGREIHIMIVKRGLEKEVFVGNTLVDMYAKHSLLSEALVVFDGIMERTVVSWNALISGYVRLGESEHVFMLFEIMLKEGIKPSRASFLNVLTTCSHMGLIEMGYRYLELMKHYGVAPTVEVHNCMINLLSRAGRLGEAFSAFNQMHTQPDLITWKTLMAGCQKWSNIELGKEVFNHVLGSEFDHPATFILMSNTYVDACI